MDSLKVANHTQEAALSGMLTSSLHEHFQTDPAAGRPSDVPGYHITATITKLGNLGISRARIRDKDSRDDESQAYQTVLFRTAVYVDFTVFRGEIPEPVLKRSYVGYGDLPKMHDHQVPFKHACQQAIHSIAQQMTDDLATIRP